MTKRGARDEERRLFREHLNRDFELATDRLLQHAVIADHARRHHRSFHHLSGLGDHQ